MGGGRYSCQQVGGKVVPSLKLSGVSERPKAAVREVAGLGGIAGE